MFIHFYQFSLQLVIILLFHESWILSLWRIPGFFYIIKHFLSILLNIKNDCKLFWKWDGRNFYFRPDRNKFFYRCWHIFLRWTANVWNVDRIEQLLLSERKFRSHLMSTWYLIAESPFWTFNDEKKWMKVVRLNNSFFFHK